jgi:type IV pilus assembly protein PilF
MSDRMSRGKHFLISVVMVLLASGCVTTTTGPAKSEANSVEAAELNYQLGARYYRNGQYELSRDRLLYSIELDPTNPVAHSTLALTYERLENVRLATQSYEKAVRIAPKNYDVLNSYAVFLCRQGDYDEAIENFDQAIGIKENDNVEITLTNAGVCLSLKPDPIKAEQYFREALSNKATYGDALLQLCLLKQQLGEYLAARAFMQRYLSSNPPSAEVLYLGMQIEVELGDERARTDYANRLLREFPQSSQARLVLEQS